MKSGTKGLVSAGLCLCLQVPVQAAWSWGSEAGTVTDGNWTLRISAVSNGYRIGNGSTTDGNAYVAGNGALDLRGIAGDLSFTLTEVGPFAFSSCTNITSIVMPDSITVLNNSCFRNANNLVSVELSTQLESIGNTVFGGCSALETVTPFLPDTVHSIGSQAFEPAPLLKGDLKLNCPQLTWLYAAFSQCASITSVDMSGSGLTTIGRYVFNRCSSLTNVVLHPQLEEIGQNAFSECRALKTVTPFLPETLVSLGSNAFNNTASLTGDLILQNPTFSMVPGNAFTQAKITSLDLSASSVTNIGNYAFSKCTALTHVRLPDNGVQHLGIRAFGGCSALTFFTPFLPRSLVSLGHFTFQKCTSLALPLELANSDLTILPRSGFERVPLTSITLPDAAMTINDSCFSLIPAGTPVYFLGKAPGSIGTNGFRTDNANNPCVLYVCRKMDEDGWAGWTTALTESDLAKASYPGHGTFGVCEVSGERHWMVHWASPLASGPFVIQLH